MPGTPDRRHGPLYEEEINLDPLTADPAGVGALRYRGDLGEFRLRDAAGVFNPRSGGALFGTAWQYAASEAVSTTTSNSYQEKVKLTTPVLVAGDYLVGWSALLCTASANKNFQARVQVDDTTTLTEIQYRNAIADQDYVLSGFAKVTLTAASHFIDLDYSSLVGSSTSIRWARLAFWRVS